jgi:BRCA2, oligonucleotide/oligosaccharide-binding, domain 3
LLMCEGWDNRDKLWNKMSQMTKDRIKEASAERILLIEKEAMRRIEKMEKFTTKMLKLWVVDYEKTFVKAVIFYENPSEEAFNLIKGGAAIELTGSSTCSNGNSNQLTIKCGSSAIVKPIEVQINTKDLEKRMCNDVPFNNVQYVTYKSNFEIICMVVHVDRETYREVFVADEDYNLLLINFVPGIHKYYENILVEGETMHVRNLEWQGTYRHYRFPVGFALFESASFSTSSRCEVIQEKLNAFRKKINEKTDYLKECQQKLFYVVESAKPFVPPVHIEYPRRRHHGKMSFPRPYCFEA